MLEVKNERKSYSKFVAKATEGKHVLQITDIDLDGKVCGIIGRLWADYKGYTHKLILSHVSMVDARLIYIEQQAKLADVIIVSDIAPSEKLMEILIGLNNIGKTVLVCDHHTDTHNYGKKYRWYNCLFTDKKNKQLSASNILMYHLFMKQKIHIKSYEMLQELVEYTRQYDTWEWVKTENITAKRLSWLAETDRNFIDNKYNILKAGVLKNIITREELAIIEKYERDMELYINNCYNNTRISEFLGYEKVGLVLANRNKSDVAHNLLNRFKEENNALDFIIVLDFTTNTGSIRTQNENYQMDIIAKTLGGGGRAKTAGFKITNEVLSKITDSVFDVFKRDYKDITLK